MSASNGDKKFGTFMREYLIGPSLLLILAAGIGMYAQLAVISTKIDYLVASGADQELRIRTLEKSKP